MQLSTVYEKKNAVSDIHHYQSQYFLIMFKTKNQQLFSETADFPNFSLCLFIWCSPYFCCGAFDVGNLISCLQAEVTFFERPFT